MKKLIFIFILALLIPIEAMAQGNAFNFQGRLNDGANPANGSYNLQFSLFNQITGGTQIGSTIARPNTPVINGVFSVNLDFDSAAFNDPNAVFIEIGVKPAASPNAFTILGPRQKLTVVPFAIKSISSETATTANNADQLDGLPSNRFVQLDEKGDVSIGTTSTGSKLTVAGVIESTTGGIKFPDATTQTTAGLTAVTTNATLTGDGTAKMPLGIASPLLVRDIDNPAFQPFQNSRGSNGIIVTVPAGKRLVVEFVSGFQILSGGSTEGAISLFVIGSITHHLAVSSVSGTTYRVNQLIKMYVSAGQSLQVAFSSASVGSSIAVSGYYVDVP